MEDRDCVWDGEGRREGDATVPLIMPDDGCAGEDMGPSGEVMLGPREGSTAMLTLEEGSIGVGTSGEVIAVLALAAREGCTDTVAGRSVDEVLTELVGMTTDVCVPLVCTREGDVLEVESSAAVTHCRLVKMVTSRKVSLAALIIVLVCSAVLPQKMVMSTCLKTPLTGSPLLNMTLTVLLAPSTL